MGSFLELKKGKDRNGKTGLNPSKDGEIEDLR